MSDALDDLVFAHRLATARLSLTAGLEWTAEEWFDAPRDTAAKLERFLGPALAQPGGGNLNTLINGVPATGSFDDGDREALHWVRSYANQGKHGTVLTTFQQVWTGMDRALAALVHLRTALPTPMPVGAGRQIRVAICELDYPHGGETEWLVFLVSPSGELSAQVDGCQLEYGGREALLASLDSAGSVVDPCPWVSEPARNQWSSNEAFVNLIGFEGAYRDFAAAIAGAQHNLALLPGLVRGAGRWVGVTLAATDSLARRFNEGNVLPPSHDDVENLAAEIGVRELGGLQKVASEVHDLLMRVPPLRHGFVLDPVPRLVSSPTLEAISIQRDVTHSEPLGAVVTPEGAIVIAV